MDVSDEQLRLAVVQIVSDGDASILTARAIRALLISKFQLATEEAREALHAKRKQIDRWAMEAVETVAEARETKKPRPKKAKEACGEIKSLKRLCQVRRVKGVRAADKMESKDAVTYLRGLLEKEGVPCGSSDVTPAGIRRAEREQELRDLLGDSAVSLSGLGKRKRLRKEQTQEPEDTEDAEEPESKKFCGQDSDYEED